MVPPRAHAEPRHMCRLCPAGQDPRHRWPMPRLRATDCCRCSDCGQAYRAGLTRTGDSWTCRRCALRRAVDQVLPAESSGTLYLLRTAILQAEQLTTRRWITRPEIAFLLTDLAAGRTPLTHESLDAQPAHTGIERLRDLLVAASACLPITPEPSRGSNSMRSGCSPVCCRLTLAWSAAGYVGRCCRTSPSCLVTPVHSAGGGILGAARRCQLPGTGPGRCQEPGTGAIFPGTGQPPVGLPSAARTATDSPGLGCLAPAW